MGAGRKEGRKERRKEGRKQVQSTAGCHFRPGGQGGLGPA